MASSTHKSPSLHAADDTFYDSVNDDPLLSPSEHNGQMKDSQEEAWKSDLLRLEDEIKTLKSVLSTKERQAGELKRRLGITPMMEFKQDLSHSINAIKESDTYQKTNAAFRSFGAFASRKMGDFRNSSAFKSVEDKVGGAYSSVKQSKSLHNLRPVQNQFVSSRSTENFDQPPTD
ncbi:hypothetical protein HELRODRAFT_163489 [Helobdella robusta]|uniref:Tumor protein D52 n=1 Tax=Helobdella robusta TaxID=6412 RepID=T1EU44_HELRO|nr:hypothetical protein HELRODRAFT_163489 [Helobdella robusta]ESN96429.1 hypothetical protein HELRODRAFT_163489 [Helobdella robusta]